MNDAEFEAIKARIITLEKRWFETLGLAAWRIDHVFVRSDFTVDGSPSPDSLAAAKCDAKYMHATISWNMPNIFENQNTDRQLEYAFLHETMHVMVNEMRPMRIATEADKALEAEDTWHEERVCTMLGWAFLWTREANRRYEPVEGEY